MAENGEPDPQVSAEPVRAWLEELRSVRRYSPNTLAAYGRDLRHLLDSAGELPLAEVSANHLRRYLARLHGQGHSPRSLARMLAAWRGFFQWWAPRIGLTANPADGLRAPRAARSLPKALPVEEAQVLLDRGAASADAPADRCDAAMFELCYGSGLRLAELVGLDVHYVRDGDYQSQGWIDLDAADVTVLGKGGKRRIVPIGRKAGDALRAWLAVRQPAVNAASVDAHALFLGMRGRRIAPRAVQQRLAQWGIRAGVPSHVHPHVLRHSFASHVLQSAGDLRAVQEMLGHASISTTQIYTKLDFQHLAAAYDKAHPRAAPPGASKIDDEG